MKRLLWVSLVLFLTACQSTPDTTISGLPAEHPFRVVDGAETAAALNVRYGDTRQNCGKNSTPAFLCSGVIMRTTTYSTAYDSWDPSDRSVALGGQSFSYLRKDSKFSRAAWSLSNGYILYPIFDAPPDKMDPDVLCLFPVDGWTDERADQRCGIFTGNPTSVSCERQNITTADQWVTHFNQQGKDTRKLCSFNVRDERNDLAGPAFYEALLAKSKGAPTDIRFTQHNELVLKTWARGIGATLPIQAFFYLDATGLGSAKKDKANFFAKTQIALPLIKLTMPTSQAADAKFEYIPGDNP